MFGLLLASVLAAFAAPDKEPAPNTYTWTIRFNGIPIGEQVLTISYDHNDKGLERVMRSTTTIDASPVDFDYQYQQILAGRATNEPAAFNASFNLGGTTGGCEVRWADSGIYVTHIDDEGKATDEVLPSTAANLSTIDLFDPLSHVALSRFESVSVLSAQTGRVWHSEVRRMGPTEVIIDGTKLLTEGLVVHSPDGRQAYYYTADGIPVRYEYYVQGRLFEAKLSTLPPPGIDDMPVPLRRPEIAVKDL